MLTGGGGSPERPEKDKRGSLDKLRGKSPRGTGPLEATGLNFKGRSNFAGVDTACPHFFFLLHKGAPVESHPVETGGLEGPFRMTEGLVKCTSCPAKVRPYSSGVGVVQKLRASCTPFPDCTLLLESFCPKNLVRAPWMAPTSVWRPFQGGSSILLSWSGQLGLPLHLR